MLRAVTLEFKIGHVNAIMGPSGAGKTTLFKMIAHAGEGCAHEYVMSIGGKPLDDATFREIGAHIPQDLFQAPVRDKLELGKQLKYTINLNNPTFSSDEVEEKFERCLRLTGLWARKITD